MADKTELRERILKAYRAINDVLAVNYEDVEPKGKDIGLAAVMMIARDAIHWALDIVDYGLTKRPASKPHGPHFNLPGSPAPNLRIATDNEPQTQPEKETKK